MKWKKMTFLAFGHFASDFYPGLLAPLLPLLTAQHGWTLTQTGILIMVMSIFMNAMQPVIGLLNDRYPLKLFLWLGPILSAVPFSLFFYLTHFEVLITALAIAGLGVAMYHPVGAVAAGHDTDENKRVVTMAFFSSGGSVGVTTAPLAVVLIINVLGIKYMPLVAIPALLMMFYFMRDNDIVVSEHQGHTLREMISSLSDNFRELTLLWVISGFRAMVYGIVSNFLALLMIARGYSYAASAYFLSASLLAGMGGMFLGGHLADRHGKRKIMALSMFVSVPLFYGFSFFGGILSVVLLLLAMVSLTSTLPVNIVLAQRAAPKLPGMASSLVMGLSFMFGAIIAPPFGALADRIGIEAAMHWMFLIPIIGGLGAMFLKNE
ncbi:MAG: MFS transporter [Candidatus Latescibacter sp.]|nr:MFS transporter [Candidatus Latescibacter sp.]